MANRIKGLTIEIDGKTTGLQKALEAVNTKLSGTKTALNDVNRLLKFDPGNTELLKQKQTYLKQAIDETNQKINEEKKALDQLEEAGKTTDNQEQQRALKREIEANEQALKNLERQAAQAASVMGSKMQAAGQRMQEVGKKITGVGRNLSMYVTAPLTAIGAAAVKVTTDFDTSMSKVQALSGATGKEFTDLRDLAREMGATTKYSASEAADALSYMALAGWDSQQMTEGLPGVLDLAAASGMDLADASDIVTDYLSAFGLEAADSAKMADQLAYAQANSNTTTTQLADAFGNSAAQMHTAGQSMETTTAILEAFANQGLKGSEAGTALSAMMRDITQNMEDGRIQIGDTTIAVQDQNGNFRDMIDILADVEAATDGMGTAEKSAALMSTFTARSVKGVSMALTEGSSNIRGYRDELYSATGTAKTMAETMQDNLAGELTKLKSALQEVGISLGDSLVPMLRKGVEHIQGLVDKFNDLDEGTKETIVKVGLFAAALGPALTAVGMMTQGLGGVVEMAGKAVTGLNGITQGLVGIPYGPVGLAIGGVAAALGLMVVSLEMQEEAYENANRSAYDAIEASEEVRKQMEKTGNELGTAFDNAETSIANATERANEATSMVARLEELTSAEQLSNSEMLEAQSIVGQLNAMYPGLNAQIDEQGHLLGITTGEIQEFIGNALEIATVEAKQQALTESTKELAEAVTAKVEANARAKQITTELESAEREYAAAVEAANAKFEASNKTFMDRSELGYELMNIEDQHKQKINDLTTEQEALNQAIIDQDAAIETNLEKQRLVQEEFDGMTEAASGASDAMTASGDAATEMGTEYEAAAGEMNEAAETIETKYQELYDSALQSLQGQGLLWQEFTLTTEHTTSELQNNLAEQTSFYQTWASDLETVWNYAVQTGDTSTIAMVQQLANMGEEGAGHVHDLAVAINDENYAMVDSFGNTVGGLQTAQSDTAAILAQIEGNMVNTAEGLVYQSDYSGQQVVSNIQRTGNNADKYWSGSLQSIQRNTTNSMNSTERAVGTGMDQVEGEVRNAGGPLERTSFNSFDRIRAMANLTAMNLGTSGETAMNNFQNGLWRGSQGVYNAVSYITDDITDYFDIGAWTYNSGLEVGYNFGDGIYNSGWYVAQAASYVSSIVWSYLHHSTPDKGALRNDDKWGGELADNFASGMISRAAEVKKAAGILAEAAVIQSPTQQAPTVNITGAEAAGAGDNITVNVYASEGMNINQLADAVQQKLALTQRQRVSAYA